MEALLGEPMRDSSTEDMEFPPKIRERPPLTGGGSQVRQPLLPQGLFSGGAGEFEWNFLRTTAKQQKERGGNNNNPSLVALNSRRHAPGLPLNLPMEPRGHSTADWRERVKVTEKRESGGEGDLQLNPR